MRNLKLHYLLFMLALLAGCAQLGLAPAQTFEQKLAYAYGTHTAVLNAATSALDAKTLKSTDAEQVIKLATESRVLLDAAKSANAVGDVNTANGKLLLGVQILEQLQIYLRARK